ncbi:DNA polymerase IV [Salinibacterium sp. PAMC 21357]|uniref:DNA polymerase IV n=1 Tax=Salinibacterium sp. PAMC 21357 TaxID=1112215 RepID=UPI000289EE2C|nr:DNA polymerase IV [Salinibacterium sp. PAMC 21357]
MGKQDGLTRYVSAINVDDSTATILHVDMDAFFASVELLDHPELIGKPVIVGHNSTRSVVTAATYEARKYGVNSAMPMALALRRCPNAIVLEPHFERYQYFSSKVFEICDELTPKVERLGIDEAFLDVAGARAIYGSPKEVASLLRSRVFAETGLVCSVGAAASKYVAKVASGLSKPDGLLVIPADKTVEFLHPLQISALWGVGAKTEENLRQRGFSTIADIAHADRESLTRAVGESGAVKLHNLAWGNDVREVSERPAEKSIGHETTFEYDVLNGDEIRRELLRLSGKVAIRLRASGMVARTVVLKLRFEDFSTVTRSRKLPEPTDLGRTLYETVRGIYDEFAAEGRPVRLVGVRGEQLVDPGGTLVSLWDTTDGWRDAEEAMEAASARFGSGAIGPARLLGVERSERPRLGQRD